MHPFWAFLLGLAVGIVVCVLIMVAVRRMNAVDAIVVQPEPSAEPPAVPDGVANLVGLLHASAIVVDTYDEVLCSNQTAVESALVRGSRINSGALLELVRQVRRTGEPANTDLHVPRGRGGANVHYAVRVASLNQQLTIALAEDRTEARRVDDVRRDFVANVSHELKTPIGAISLLAETIQGAADDPEAVRKFAERMSTESIRLTEMVRQIIELSQLQAEDPLQAGEPIELDELFADVADRIRVDAEAREVWLRIAGDPGSVVFGNRVQLTSAVSNLVENAVAYSDIGARVVVAAHHRDGEEPAVDITVSDNGIGISQQEQERIFERFYRVDYSRSRLNGGTGLGLSIVKHVAAVHGGHIDLWSRPGEGSTFTITIPDHPSLFRDDVMADEETDGPTERTDQNQEVRL